MTEPKIHKAQPAPDFAQDAVSTCLHCHREIQRVPGGNGPLWVHSHSGAVVGHGPTLESVASMADHVRAVRRSLIALQEFECTNALQAESLQGLLDAWDEWEYIAGTAADVEGGVQS